MIDIATVIVIALPSAIAGGALVYTLMRPKDEGSPNVCDDAVTIERLREDLEYWQEEADTTSDLLAVLYKENDKLRAENRDLHIDIAEKAKRLSDAGLQSAGGCDAA